MFFFFLTINFELNSLENKKDAYGPYFSFLDNNYINWFRRFGLKSYDAALLSVGLGKVESEEAEYAQVDTINDIPHGSESSSWGS